MPIDRLLSFAKLAPERQDVLKLAFVKALRDFNLVDRNDPICELVARKIIEVASRDAAANAATITEIARRELCSSPSHRTRKEIADE